MADQASQYSGILDQDLFNQYSARWIEVINRRDPEELREIFKEDDVQLTGLGFSITQITRLVGTIGAAHIKARFIVQPNTPGTSAQFSIALFATDSLNARVSSYYVPEKLYTDKLAFTPPKSPGLLTVHKNQLHHVLAERWRQNWIALAVPQPEGGEPQGQPGTDLLTIKPEYFDTHYGPMRGYTYEINEFVALFLLLDKLDSIWLKIHFVLHDFYQPDPLTSGDQLAETFALALQVKRPPSPPSNEDYGAGDNPQDDPKDDPILDMGAPCPPQC